MGFDKHACDCVCKSTNFPSTMHLSPHALEGEARSTCQGTNTDSSLVMTVESDGSCACRCKKLKGTPLVSYRVSLPQPPLYHMLMLPFRREFAPNWVKAEGTLTLVLASVAIPTVGKSLAHGGLCTLSNVKARVATWSTRNACARLLAKGRSA